MWKCELSVRHLGVPPLLRVTDDISGRMSSTMSVKFRDSEIASSTG